MSEQEPIEGIVVRRGGEVVPWTSSALLEWQGTSLEQLTHGLDPEVVAKWAYSLPKGKNKPPIEGLGVRGVEEALRLLEQFGEPIRIEIRLDNETDRDCFVTARATRFVKDRITGKDEQMGSIERGVRQPKYGRTQGGSDYFIERWYEMGVSKAIRNAVRGLLPARLQQLIEQAGKDAERQLAAEGEPRSEEAAAPRVNPKLVDFKTKGADLQAKRPETYKTSYRDWKVRYPYALTKREDGRTTLLPDKLSDEDLDVLIGEVEGLLTMDVATAQAAAEEPTGEPLVEEGSE